jgi:hypothetical protein
MKANKGLIIGLAAVGLAVAGTVIFFTATKTGKKTIKKWNLKNKKLTEGVRSIVKDAKKKIKDLKAEIETEYKAGEVTEVMSN